MFIAAPTRNYPTVHHLVKRPITAYSRNRTLLCKEDEWYTTTHNNIGESHKYNVEQKQPVIKECMLYDSTDTKFKAGCCKSGQWLSLGVGVGSEGVETEKELVDIPGTGNILFPDLGQGFSSTTDIRDQTILCCGVCSAHCRRFSSIAGLYTLDATSIHKVVTVKNVSGHCQINIPWEAEVPRVENHWPKI